MNMLKVETTSPPYASSGHACYLPNATVITKVFPCCPDKRCIKSSATTHQLRDIQDSISHFSIFFTTRHIWCASHLLENSPGKERVPVSSFLEPTGVNSNPPVDDWIVSCMFMCVLWCVVCCGVAYCAVLSCETCGVAALWRRSAWCV